MIELHLQLVLSRCPHCGVDRPNLRRVAAFDTTDYNKKSARNWACYQCARCGGVTTAYANRGNTVVQKMYPPPIEVDETIPDRAKEYLEQSINSISAPAGAVMLAASAVDAMLKSKGLTEGTLYTRIKKAAEQHLITKQMEEWVHDVRLDANDQRHADEDAPLPTSEDARRVIDFVQALGMFLFVLPARVKRGISDAKSS